MDGNRTQPRFRRLKNGEVAFGKLRVPCTVRNLSECGAELKFQTAYGLPGTFALKIAAEPPRTCRARWLTDTMMGVQFV